MCVRNATSGCKESGRRGKLKGARLQTVETATEPMAHDSGRPKPGESDWVWPSRQEEPDGETRHLNVLTARGRLFLWAFFFFCSLQLLCQHVHHTKQR